MRRALASIALVALAAAPATAGQWWVPATAHGDGAQGSVWRSTFVVSNFGDIDEDLTLALLPQGTDNSNPTMVASLSVGAGETVEVDDIVLSLFGFAGTAALRIDANGDQLVITSRTFNQSDNGTFGQSIPGVTTGAALMAGSQAVLVGLGGSGGQRTNIGWVNTDGRAIEVTVSLYDNTGTLLAEKAFPTPAYGQTQLNLFDRMGAGQVSNAYVRLSATGRIVPYASVVASGSNDPIYVSAMSELDAATEQVFPAVAHVAGAGGTSWGSDAWLLNVGSDPARVRLELWRQGETAPLMVELDESIAPGAQLELADLVQGVLGLDDGQGALVVRSDSLLLATSRTFNTADSGTFGQFIPARAIAALGGIGESLYLAGAVENQSFRSNLGLYATSDGSVVDLTLRAADGAAIANDSVTLAAHEQMQKKLSWFFATTGFAGATVEVTLRTADDSGARLAAYLSTVDNLSTDPTFSHAARGFGADPGTEQIDQAIVATTYALSKAVDSSGPRWVGKVETTVDCITIDYQGDRVPPGQSPDGKCWTIDISFDSCAYELPNAGWGLSQDGVASADVCIIDGYPSELEATLTTTIEDLNTGAVMTYGLDAVLDLVLTFSGALPEAAHVVGEGTVTANDAWIELWADLTWDGQLGGYAFIPVGALKMVVPYETVVSTTADVLASFDGSEWVYVQVRLGYFQTSFYFNLFTGEVRL